MIERHKGEYVADNTINHSKSNNDKTEVRAILSKDGLSFEDPDIIDAAANVNISNSLISSLRECPARAAADKWILKDILQQEPLAPTVLGSAFHSVMERFFTLPPDERTIEGIRKSYLDVLNDPDYNVIAMDWDATIWLQNAVNGYWSMGIEDPRKVHVPESMEFTRVSRDGEEYTKKDRGLELFVEGKIADGLKHKVLGFIDRISINDDTGLYVIDDWKTGKRASEYLPKKQKYPDFGYVRQQVLYTMMVEEAGYSVEKARLIYPIATYEDPVTGRVSSGHVTVIDVKNGEYREKAVSDVKDADATLTQSVELNRWDCGPSPLCSWCPLVSICPAALKIKKQNAVDARDAAPSERFLRDGGIVRG